jgi:SWI/SNF-related matrix-associated actin-dependent regulator of chromatin subfamily A member 5
MRSARDPSIKKMLRQFDQEERQTNVKRNKSTNSRRRKTEKEEDAELMEDEEHEDDGTTVLTESPSYVQGKLREYQIQGLNWLISLHDNSLSGILADEMGLGKTLQTISFLGYLRYYKNIDGPFIVIVPKSTLDNWRREFQKWTPDVNVCVLQGTKEERTNILQNTILEAKFDVLVTSFEMVIREKASLKKIAWQYIVIDEAHRIKNEESALSQIIRLFYSKNRLLITGTPLQNNLHELWALLNFLLPDVFGDSEAFDQWFENNEDDQDKVVQQLHKVLSPFLLRRVKADVEKSLLPKKELNLYVGMSGMQVKWYKNLLEKDIDAVNGVVGKREGKTRLLNIVMQLRKCCNHPYLFEGAEPGPPYTTDEHLVYNSGKMIVLDKLLKKMKEQGSRVLIFSQMSRLLDILEDYCFLRDWEYCRIDGSTSHEERVAAIDEYNKPDSEKFIFLLTTRAGGLGINLTSADIVVLYDSDWNPQADLQAMDRAHRIGQKKQVHVYRFVTEKAIEEKVIERAAQKLRLDQLVIQQGRTSNKNNSVGNTTDDLLGMIQYGAKEVFENKTSNVDADIDDILKKGEERTASLNARYSSLGLDDLQKFTSEHSAYEWNGENFAKKSNDGGFTWINPSKRERKEAVYSVDGYYKDVLQSKATPQPKVPKAPKSINIQDHQFFDPHLKELLEKEQLSYKRSVNYKVTAHDFEDDENEDDENAPSLEERRKIEQAKINTAEPLTEEEEQLKQQYIDSAFTTWSRRDFTNFIQYCARFGRENTKLIAEQYTNKDEEEIKRYSESFWTRYKEIDGYEKYISQIEAGEKKARKMLTQSKLLAQKVSQTPDPLEHMTIQYPPNNSKRVYSLQEDRFLLVTVNKFGLLSENLYEQVKAAIRKSEHFKFDWFFLSRTPQELSRRTNTLLLAVTREFEGPDALKRKKNRSNTDNASNNTGTTTPNGSRQGTAEPSDTTLKRTAETFETQNKKVKVEN